MSSTSSTRFIGLGWTLWDDVVRLPRFPQENAKVAAVSNFGQVGGPTVRALLLLSRFGADCALLSGVGDDQKGDSCIEELKRNGLNLSGVRRNVDSSTRVAHVWLSAETGSRTIAYSDDNSELPPLHATQVQGALAVLSDARYPDALRALCESAREYNVPVIIDMGSYKSHVAAFVERTDVLIGPAATWDRLAADLGHEQSIDAMRSLENCVCVRTNGASQITASAGVNTISYTPPAVPVIDANGAGDVFFGAFAWWWSQTKDVARAVSFGANAAALKCTRIGNRTLPTLAEVERFEANLPGRR